MYTSAINRRSTNRIESRIFQFLAIYVIFCITPAFIELISVTTISITAFSRLYSTICFLSLILLFIQKYNSVLDKWGWTYCISLLCFLIFHHKTINETINPFTYSIRWINLILLIYIYQNRMLDTRFLSRFALVFFVCECSCCIMEKIGHFYFIDYKAADLASATNMEAYEYDSKDFRSRGLLLHPLINANVISIFTAFVLVSNKLNKFVKWLLLLLGLLGIWACNSRACIAVWLFILLYKFFLYNKKLRHILFSVFLLYFIAPWLFEIIQRFDILGRFDFDFKDSSSETRLIAFPTFFSYPWNIESIITGIGDWIYYPLSNISLENGFLLNWAYWGWIIGSVKSFTEIYLTYKCLFQYNLKDKLIIMFAVWGVASGNNNLVNIQILAYFFLAYLFQLQFFKSSGKLNN